MVLTITGNGMGDYNFDNLTISIDNFYNMIEENSKKELSRWFKTLDTKIVILR